MSVVILNVLCEGQTEEKFVKNVLKDYLAAKGIVVKHRLLVTSEKKNGRGGITSYQKVKGDIEKWYKEVSGRSTEKHYFTTMFDFYGLPNDFPGYDDNGSTDAYIRVGGIEEKFAEDINRPDFIPYIQLHEFEALLFSDISKLTDEYPGCEKEIKVLQDMLDKDFGGNPELVNHGVNTAPSKRIIKAIEGKRKYHYNKPRSGAAVAGKIGMETLRLKCSHFNKWIEDLEKHCK